MSILCFASCDSITVQNECEITYHYYIDVQKTEEVSEEQLVPGQAYYLFVNYKGKNYYIPFMKKFIISVSDKITINELEGLFNEN